ncbi:conjugal transfer protein TraH [Photobacterium sp. ZSDE20]|uniref:Conjugal transfer protein TraH n=1 Tax=Photobacterium pectinilyticum TaxID=2906793 RepID=A0ABT1N3H7_9GAMM|nr:conjugal transfer protein TraH [Photobacterium sp. ZSDE20]MCQ1058409.1 conjugal transfer protein TraH [Photobacterium sp. ZSDE20]MDD1825228.1 conjugal transfer protein TraH [Photobacterium sp. ZSDE20]
MSNFSQRFKLKPLVFGMAVAVLISTPIEVSASTESLRSSVDKIFGFTTTSSKPERFQLGANGRRVYSGGATSIRFRTQPFNVINFQAPRANIGCGGIDFYGGSIDLMSSDQLIQAGRAIASAATVYAFRLALNSICSSCMSIMSNIQAMMQEFNRIAQTDCQSALNAINTYSPFGNPDDGLNQNHNAVEGSIAQMTGDWVKTLENNNNNWLDALAAAGDTKIEDVGSPSMVADFSGYPGYYYAYNTDLYTRLFPWLDVEQGRAATWAMLSQSSMCADQSSSAAFTDGDDPTRNLRCALGGEYTHSYADFLLGPMSNSESSSKTKDIVVPACNNEKVKTLGQNNVTVKSCDAAEGAVTPMNTTITPLFEGFMSTAYGPNVTSLFHSALSDEVCTLTDKIHKDAGGLFVKVLSYGGQQLSTDELNLASALGTGFTLELYRSNNDGKLLTNQRIQISCRDRFEIFHAELYRYFYRMTRAADEALSKAQTDLKDNYELVLDTAQKQILIDRIESIREDVEASLHTLETVIDISRNITTGGMAGE